MSSDNDDEVVEWRGISQQSSLNATPVRFNNKKTDDLEEFWSDNGGITNSSSPYLGRPVCPSTVFRSADVKPFIFKPIRLQDLISSSDEEPKAEKELKHEKKDNVDSDGEITMPKPDPDNNDFNTSFNIDDKYDALESNDEGCIEHSITPKFEDNQNIQPKKTTTKIQKSKTNTKEEKEKQSSEPETEKRTTRNSFRKLGKKEAAVIKDKEEKADKLKEEESPKNKKKTIKQKSKEREKEKTKIRIRSKSTEKKIDTQVEKSKKTPHTKHNSAEKPIEIPKNEEVSSKESDKNVQRKKAPQSKTRRKYDFNLSSDSSDDNPIIYPKKQATEEDSEDMDLPIALRRSRRIRVKPLKHWKQQRIAYEVDENGLYTFKEVTHRPPSPKSQKLSQKGKSKDSAKSDEFNPDITPCPYPQRYLTIGAGGGEVIPPVGHGRRFVHLGGFGLMDINGRQWRLESNADFFLDRNKECTFLSRSEEPLRLLEISFK